MTFASAYKDYWLSFGLPVYDENTVPDTAQMPYITYQYNENGFDDGEVFLSVSLWYKGYSWLEADLKAAEIKRDIQGFGGKVIKCDEGYIWLKRSSPFIQRVNDPNENIRHVLINVAVEFF